MSVHASHHGIAYEIEKIGEAQWRWSFLPPVGPRRTGRVRGRFEWATTVVTRAIEIWHLMNPAFQLHSRAIKEIAMAASAPSDDGHRNGAIREPSQLQTKIEGEGHWTARDKEAGQFMDQKDEAIFKSVRREHR
jgi:hypothetical protein